MDGGIGYSLPTLNTLLLSLFLKIFLLFVRWRGKIREYIELLLLDYISDFISVLYILRLPYRRFIYNRREKFTIKTTFSNKKSLYMLTF